MAFATGAAASELSRGVAALEAGDYELAERELRIAVAADPRSAAAFYQLGIAHARQGEDRESVNAIRRALEIDPDIPGAHLLQGIGYYNLDQYDTAQAEFELAAAEDPGDASTELFLGLNAQALGDHDRAIGHFERSALADPDLAQVALYNAGVSEWKAGRSDEAVASLDRSVAVAPETEIAASARDLRGTIERSDESSKRWSFTGTAGTEYDSNVEESLVDLTSGDVDVVGIFDVSTSVGIVRTEHTDVDLSYDFYQTLHRNETDFDLQSHSASLGASREFGWLDVGATYQFSYAMLAWDKLLLLHGARPNLAVSPFPWWYIETSYQYWYKDFDDSSRDANHHGIGLDQYFFFQEQQAYFRVGYRAATENADGAEFDFFGHFAEAGLHLPFFESTELDLTYGYFNKDYSNETPDIGEDRHDQRHRVAVALTWHFFRYIIAGIEYEFTYADSNLPSADFNQHIAGVKLGFDF